MDSANQKTIWTAIIVAIIFGGGGFYAGTMYSGSSSAQGQYAQGGAGGARTGGAYGGGNYAGRTGRGGAAGGGFASGTIVSSGNGTVTIQLANSTSTNAQSGTKIVFVGANTTVTKTSVGSAADLTQGETVTVGGTANSDGSITATMVQIRPAGMQGGMGGMGGGANAANSAAAQTVPTSAPQDMQGLPSGNPGQ